MTKEIFNQEASSVDRNNSSEDNWWSSLTSIAKKQAKKFWTDYNESVKKQIPTKKNLKKGVIYKAITAKKKD